MDLLSAEEETWRLVLVQHVLTKSLVFIQHVHGCNVCVDLPSAEEEMWHPGLVQNFLTFAHALW